MPAGRNLALSLGGVTAADYNEIKEFGGKTSSRRSAQQTETARFWLMVGPQAYHPLARQLILERHLNLNDSARFMALFAVTLTDAYIAAFDAKYHYNLWRPVTAIRNADLNDNLATTRDASWPPLDNTPMHPEYPAPTASERRRAGGPRVTGSADAGALTHQSDRARRDTSLVDPGCLHDGGGERANLGGFSLPLLDPGRHGPWAGGWPICDQHDDAASQ